MADFLKIALCSDHAGYLAKLKLKEFLLTSGHTLTDFGSYSADSCDYADFAHPLADAMEKNQFDVGFALCGSGNGINITVNKHQGIRGALCWKPEIAQLARMHNNANVCSLPARFLSDADILEIVSVFLTTAFEGGRHQFRIDKIPVKK